MRCHLESPRGLRPRTRNANKHWSVSKIRTYRLRRSPRRDFEETSPRIAKAPPTAHHVLGDRRLGDFEPKHQQFAVDPRCTPEWILAAHPLDEGAQATINLRPPCPILGLPTPEYFEASAMPPQDGLPLNHLSSTDQARPEPGHPYEQRPVTAAQSKTRRCPPQSNVELMTEKQVLGFEPASRLEHVGGEHSERAQDRKH